MLKRGDTIIEVVMAVAVFSFVAIGAMTVMNNGLAMAQRSLEITLVRQQIDSQAEMLRFVHSKARSDKDEQYIAIWDSLPKTLSTPEQVINDDTCSEPTDAFVLVPATSGIVKTENFDQPATYSRVAVDDSTGVARAQGISIQITPTGGGGAYDAYVQACWHSLGSSHPMTIGTIVRIYDAGAS